MEKQTLHFDLSHCPHDVKFQLRSGGKTFPLTAYKDAPEKLAAHKKQNLAVRMIADQNGAKLTHFVENAELNASAVSLNQVVYPSLDDHPLPELAMVFVHIPTAKRKKAIQKFRKKAPHPQVLSHYKIHENALKSMDNKSQDELRLHAGQVKPPFETARTLVLQHPEIGSVNGLVAAYVVDRYIKHDQDFQNLVEYIENHPPESDNTWYQKTYASWINPDTGKEEPIPANTDLTYKGGEKADWPNLGGTPVIPQYDLTDEYNDPKDKGVVTAAAPTVQKVLKLTKNDDTLNGQLWTKQAGETCKSKTHVQPPEKTPETIALIKSDAQDAKGFAIRNTTSSYGLYLYDNQMKYDYDRKTLSFPVKNWPSRYLGTYVQFFKSDGSVIKRSDISGWNDPMPDFLRSVLEPSGTKNYLDWVSAGNSVFGIPVPPLTNQTDIVFLWPQQATTANVLLGGFGIGETWDPDVDVVGILGTGLVCYGVAAMSMALTVYIVNPFLASLKGDAKFAFYALAGVIGVSAGVVGGLEYKTSAGKMILTKIANMAASMIFGIGIKKVVEMAGKAALEETIGIAVSEITTEEIAEQIPIAGWALKIASVAADLAAITATTVECLLSPPTYVLQIQHTMDLTVRVKPDPAHGKPGVPPDWPLVADHYVVEVSYPKGKNHDGGTAYRQAGPMPGSHNTPIDLKFEGIPAGGKIEVTASIYSDNNWLAGRWSSGWVNADPDKEDQMHVEGSIKENLVPLTSETLYSQKQRLNYSDQILHYWQVTLFSISDSLAGELNDKVAGPGVRKAFEDNGNPLSDQVTVSVVTPNKEWNLTDETSGTHYHIEQKTIYNNDNQTLYELSVQDLTHAAPPIPEVIHDCGPDGHRMCTRKNMTINDKEYQLGYAWQASGQNMPRDFGTENENSQMYTFQSISTLGQPQDSIIEPSRGFTQPAYIAFDQFGLTPLFELAMKYQEGLDAGGDVPTPVAEEFGKFGIPLPPDARVTVVTAGSEWLISLPDQDPLYDLKTVDVIEDGAWTKAINVYAWPIPELDNYYLDSRFYSEENKLYYLRGVKFQNGASTFDYDQTKSWGCFCHATVNDMAVHPSGYVVAADYDNHKLLALRLPHDPVEDKDAPQALPLAGEGLREGLMNKPKALTVTSDGRILILEEGNKRIQAFDIKGNPVSCFSIDQPSFKLDPSLIPDLASGVASTALVQAFQTNITPATSPLFYAEISSAAALNQGSVDMELVSEFITHGYLKKDETPNLSVVVTQANAYWLVTDETSKMVYDIRADKTDNDLAIYRCFVLGIRTESTGHQWRINDTANSMVFDATSKDGKSVTVQQLISYMPLEETDIPGITYLDIAVEAKGYIYVLSRDDRADLPVFRLRLYSPDGTPLRKGDQVQTGVNAEKLAVDQWRSLFTLNLDIILGPSQRTEPGVSEWMPSTPGAPSSS
jgi:hypothetical protein